MLVNCSILVYICLRVDKSSYVKKYSVETVFGDKKMGFDDF